MIKQLSNPKTDAGKAFIEKYGEKFAFPPMQRGKTVIMSAKTGELLEIEAREDGKYVNNQKMEW